MTDPEIILHIRLFISHVLHYYTTIAESSKEELLYSDQNLISKELELTLM
jgi:hypothetical protein